MKYIKIQLLLSFLLFFFLSCGRNSESYGRFRDDLGRPIKKIALKTGIVSLAPNATEMVVFLKSGSRLVGVTKFCKPLFPGLRARIVGGMISPNLERIQLLKPALVLLSYEGTSSRTAIALKRLSLSTYVFRVESFQGLQESLRRFAALLLVSVDKSVLKLQKIVSNFKGKLKNKRLFFHIPGGRSVYTFGRKTLLGDLVERTGAVNVAASLSGRFPRVSPERLALLSPDIVVVLAKSNGEFAAQQRRFWKQVVPNAQIIFAADSAFFRPGPGLVLAFARLVNYL